MRTSASYNSLQELTGTQSQNLGAGTIAGKSRPVTGVILLAEASASGTPGNPFISAECVLNGGIAATATFQSPWPIARGMYYDVEARSKDGDGAFLMVSSLPKGEARALEALPARYFFDAVFSAAGRFGAYGAPTDVKLVKSTLNAEGTTRYVEIQFSALTPSLSEVPRRALIAATVPKGSDDVLMLVGGAATSRWKKGGEETVRAAVDSFKVSETRATKLRRVRSSDYRFEKQGGLWASAADSNEALFNVQGE